MKISGRVKPLRLRAIKPEAAEAAREDAGDAKTIRTA